VLLLGAPDPAVRAALLLSLVAGARRRDRALAMEGALASAYLGMTLFDAGAPGRAGFQLSFAGAAGLARIAPSVDASLRQKAAWIPSSMRGALAAGVGATLATLPIVAWHFESLSLVGVPGTIVAGPVVSVAIGGLLMVLAAGTVSHGLASFLAGGTDVLLAVLVEIVRWLSSPSWVAFAVPRAWVIAGAAGWAGAGLLLLGATGLGRRSRRLVLAAGAATAVLLAPVARTLADSGTVAIEVLDVGQGDAILIRSPARRWVLVDAGPRSEGWDAGARVVVPALRARGARRLETLVLTHPHLDHVGGAAAVLRAVPVGMVVDPGQPFGTGGFVDALEAARATGTPWMAIARGTVLDVDGMTLEVLHPSGAGMPPGGDPNDLSVVLLLRYGAFTALLTGDAPRSVEEELTIATGPVHVLKVGHHGSRTSSSSSFLATARPQVALVSAGRGNRFGHPHPGAMDRLRAVGVRIHRTDREGVLSIRALEDGRWTLSTERAPD
jgi:competence protein ComEC